VVTSIDDNKAVFVLLSGILLSESSYAPFVGAPFTPFQVMDV
jgi:hypothetical protein